MFWCIPVPAFYLSSKHRSTHVLQGAGLLCSWRNRLLFSCALQVERVFPRLDQCSEEERVQRLLELKLRYFTPREVANLMGFPSSLGKPSLWSHHSYVCEPEPCLRLSQQQQLQEQSR